MCSNKEHHLAQPVHKHHNSRMTCSSLRQLSDNHGHTLPSELWYRQRLQQSSRLCTGGLVLLTEITGSHKLLHITVKTRPQIGLLHRMNCPVTSQMTSIGSVMVQRQTLLPQITNIRHHNQFTILPIANNKGVTLGVLLISKVWVQHIPITSLRNQMLQGDAYTGNWLSAIRHTPKLAHRMIHNELGHRAIS